MRVPVAVSTGLIAALVVAPATTRPTDAVLAAPAPAAAAAVSEGVTALYQMNEPAGATTMVDSSGNGNNATVHQPTTQAPNNGVLTGKTYDGATAYEWPRRAPAVLPVESNRIIQVADDPAIEPGSQDFTIEIRYRTRENFGNIIQKGQATTRGGQWKIQNPQGRPSCLFQGTTPTGADPNDYQVATRSPNPLNDNEWHVLTCTLTQAGVRMYVDGVQVNRKNGAIGVLDNKIAMTIGGKINCDQIDTTCDYFSGQIDYIKITKGPTANGKPTAAFTSTCSGLACGFDSSGSSDPDGDNLSYAWDFGDGATSSAANPSHTYDVAGRYQVELRVTDPSGGTDRATKAVNVSSGTPPGRPRNVKAEPGNALAKVSWKAPLNPGSSPIDGYVVTSTPGGQKCSTDGATSCFVTGLTNGTTYTFQIVARSAAGSGNPSNPTNAVTPVGPPTAPGSVAAVPGKRQVKVTWTKATPGGVPITGYVITSSAGGSPVTAPASARSVVIRGLTNGNRYRFTVAATSSAGRGAGRTTPFVVPVGKPGKPTAVDATPRKKAALVTWKAPRPSGAPVLRYKVQATGGKQVVVAAGRLRVVMSQLASGKRLAFRVAAVNRIGAGSWSAWSGKVTIR